MVIPKNILPNLWSPICNLPYPYELTNSSPAALDDMPMTNHQASHGILQRIAKNKRWYNPCTGRALLLYNLESPTGIYTTWCKHQP